MADFGLTEDMYGANYFRQQERREGEDEEKVPIKWMAPESLEDNIYNEATDVVSNKNIVQIASSAHLLRTSSIVYRLCFNELFHYDVMFKIHVISDTQGFTYIPATE